MNIICINSKNYKLQLNKVYSVVDELNNYYVIVNDAGMIAKYGKTLFEVQQENAMDQQNAEFQNEEAVKRGLTEDEIIEHIEVESVHDNDGWYKFNIKFPLSIIGDQYSDFQELTTISMCCNRASNISCGINVYDEVGDFVNTLEDSFCDLELDDDYDKLYEAILQKTMSEIFDKRAAAFAMISIVYDNIYDRSLNLLYAMFDTKTDVLDNPNSGNDIVVMLKNLR